jgi:hypothetical protein
MKQKWANKVNEQTSSICSKLAGQFQFMILERLNFRPARAALWQGHPN